LLISLLARAINSGRSGDQLLIAVTTDLPDWSARRIQSSAG